MALKIIRFILSVLMAGLMFVPLGYIDPSLSVFTKTMQLFEVEYIGYVFMSYIIVIVFNGLMSLTAMVTKVNNFKEMSVNTSFISSILLLNFAIVGNKSEYAFIFIILGIVVLLYEAIVFFARGSISYYIEESDVNRTPLDYVRLTCVLVSYLFIGINSSQGGDSAMHYHWHLLIEYGDLANGINMFICFLFQMCCALSLITIIKNLYKIRMHASIFNIVLYFILFFIPFYVRSYVYEIANIIHVSAFIGLVVEICSIAIDWKKIYNSRK